MSSHLFGTPRTKLGFCSIGLAVAFLILMFARESMHDLMVATITNPLRRTSLIQYDNFMLLCGLASGVVGVIALKKRKDFSWLVWLALLPTLFVLTLFIAEILYEIRIIG
jgi:hypothetical protein